MFGRNKTTTLYSFLSTGRVIQRDIQRIDTTCKAISMATLTLFATAVFSTTVSNTVHAENTEPSHSSRVEVIDVDVSRNEVKFNRIDSENFEVTLATGLMAIEDFDTGTVISGRLAFHLSEHLFVEASYSISEGDRTSYEELRPDVTLIRDSDRDYQSWDVSAGVNIFPGETWLFGRAYSSDVYLLAGWGETDFGGNKWSTINVGLGYRLFLTDWIALRVDVRDHIFNRDIFGEDDRTNNFETSLGFSVFF